MAGFTSAALASDPQKLNVADCVRLALERSPAVQRSVFQVAGAAAQVREARSAYAPRLLAEGEYGHAKGFDEVITNGGSTAALLTLEATLLDGGARNAQLAAAQAQLRGAEARAAQQHADLAFDVRSAYFTAVARRAEVTAHRDSVQTLQGWVAWLQAQQQRGLIPGDDAGRAQLALTTAEVAWRDAAAEVQSQCVLLQTLTQTQVSPEMLDEPLPLGEVAPDSEAIDASPVLTDAREAVAASRHEVDVVRAQRREKVDITGSAGFLGVNPGPTFRDNGGAQFLLGVRLPLLDATAAPRLDAALAAESAAQASFELTRQTVANALARARIDAENARLQALSWSDAIPRALDAFQVMRARYTGGGNVRLLEVLDALSQSVHARVSLQEAQLAQRLAKASEHQIVGDATP